MLDKDDFTSWAGCSMRFHLCYSECVQLKSIYFWNFSLNILAPRLTMSNWNCKKQTPGLGGYCTFFYLMSFLYHQPFSIPYLKTPFSLQIPERVFLEQKLKLLLQFPSPEATHTLIIITIIFAEIVVYEHKDFCPFPGKLPGDSSILFILMTVLTWETFIDLHEWITFTAIWNVNLKRMSNYFLSWYCSDCIVYSSKCISIFLRKCIISKCIFYPTVPNVIKYLTRYFI